MVIVLMREQPTCNDNLPVRAFVVRPKIVIQNCFIFSGTAAAIDDEKTPILQSENVPHTEIAGLIIQTELPQRTGSDCFGFGIGSGRQRSRGFRTSTAHRRGQASYAPALTRPGRSRKKFCRL